MKEYQPSKIENSMSFFFGLRKRKTDTSSSKTKYNNERPYTPPTEKLMKSPKIRYDYLTPLILTVLSVFTRLIRVGSANYVVWDESHFGLF